VKFRCYSPFFSLFVLSLELFQTSSPLQRAPPPTEGEVDFLVRWALCLIEFPLGPIPQKSFFSFPRPFPIGYLISSQSCTRLSIFHFPYFARTISVFIHFFAFSPVALCPIPVDGLPFPFVPRPPQFSNPPPPTPTPHHYFCPDPHNLLFFSMTKEIPPPFSYLSSQASLLLF